jgi:hypothetical protein
VLAADGGPGSAGDRGEAGVGGEVSGGGEVLADDLGEDGCAGPDADAGHGHQDLGKRVRRHEFLDLLGDLSALLTQRRELRGQPGQDHAGGVGAGDHDGLRPECGEDLLGEPAAEPWCLLQQPRAHPGLPRSGESGWGGPGFE